MPTRTRYPGLNGTVYFLSDQGLTRIKIGKTANTAKRVLVFQASSPEPLFLVGEVVGYTNVERWFHHTFAHARIHSEWFVVDELVGAMIYRVQTEGREASHVICPEAVAADVPKQKRLAVLTPELVNEARGRFEHGESLASISQRFPEQSAYELGRATIGITFRGITPLANKPKKGFAKLLRARYRKCSSL